MVVCRNPFEELEDSEPLKPLLISRFLCSRTESRNVWTPRAVSRPRTRDDWVPPQCRAGSGDRSGRLTLPESPQEGLWVSDLKTSGAGETRHTSFHAGGTRSGSSHRGCGRSGTDPNSDKSIQGSPG